MERKNISTNSFWENALASSRAVRIGNYVHVSGTTAINSQGVIVGLGDPYLQTKQIIKNIESALVMAGGSLKDVVRTRIYVTSIARWKSVSKAHAECFGDICPACSLIEVNKLLTPEMLVLIEADAVISETESRSQL
ncbi:hypothetical protein NIES4102_19450 [Chondrocystis sp. NIES-4102]|nr:hypothetical protein NIES4102_19450 [Chondrocystis sp. NIES-4102]